jgi:AmiR/NasT family two-component response regulator
MPAPSPTTPADPPDAIRQAEAIVMSRYDLGARQAFDLLVRVAQRERRELREVAEDIVFTAGR